MSLSGDEYLVKNLRCRYCGKRNFDVLEAHQVACWNMVKRIDVSDEWFCLPIPATHFLTRQAAVARL